MKTKKLSISNLQKELERLDRKDSEQHDLLEEGFYSKELFIKRNKALQEERAGVLEALKNARETMPKQIDYRERISCFKAALDSLKDNEVDAAVKNMLLKKCIVKIVYSRHTENRSKWDKTPFEIDVQLLI